MKKAILVMDMPKVCLDCPMCFKAEEMSIDFLVYKHLYTCRFVPSDVEDFYIENIAKGKPDWCPLREIPDKKEMCGKYPQLDGITRSYKVGWNACIDEIVMDKRN